ncbi:site-specific DNA-methyltransferase [bacterium]|nr:site-specific DNA-methyltransferase [bacterium]
MNTRPIPMDEPAELASSVCYAAGADAARLDALLRDVRTSNDAVAAMLGVLAAEAGCEWGWTEPVTAGGGGDEFDVAPTGDGPTRTTVGDLWVIGGRHRLLVGDATDPAAVARLFAGAVPFLMVTDPPYGVDYDPDWRNAAAEAGHLGYAARRTGTVANDGRADWAAAYALFPGAVAYVWHAGRHAATVAAGLEAAGLGVRSQIVWRKPHFAISRGHYHWQHEPCWYAVREGPSARWCGDRTQSTVWDITNRVNAEDRNDHGTQKPLECMARPIRNHGGDGDVVYDPFLGSGTTLVAAHRLGRACYGCELDPAYADVILRRAEAEGLAVEKAG